jgi:hypothetical protein
MSSPPPFLQIEVPDKEVLRKWRKNHEKQQALRAQEEDLDAVASLGHQPIDPALRNKEFPKLAQKRIDKRNTHDLTVKQFEVSSPLRPCLFVVL